MSRLAFAVQLTHVEIDMEREKEMPEGSLGEISFDLAVGVSKESFAAMTEMSVLGTSSGTGHCLLLVWWVVGAVLAVSGVAQ